MERYTKKDGDGYYVINGEELFEDQCENYCGPAADRLAAIEDILGDEYDLDRLSVMVNQRMTMRDEVSERFSLTKDIPLDRLRKLVEADREGRCVVLPVKPGTPVWSTAFCKVDDDGTEHPTYPWPFDIGMANEWGTEWFLTQEEAEAALRREQDG